MMRALGRVRHVLVVVMKERGNDGRCSGEKVHRAEKNGPGVVFLFLGGRTDAGKTAVYVRNG